LALETLDSEYNFSQNAIVITIGDIFSPVF